MSRVTSVNVHCGIKNEWEARLVRLVRLHADERTLRGKPKDTSRGGQPDATLESGVRATGSGALPRICEFHLGPASSDFEDGDV